MAGDSLGGMGLSPSYSKITKKKKKLAKTSKFYTYVTPMKGLETSIIKTDSL